ncbi:hypothetical protein Pmani_025222 [Petrolisthes manimaculis]|uniref:Uncharacterized protein n=1 Tax=Petrolisthes manimaculis TaxID=1843537 RepID=A0AAE1U1E0_9EUCA|nr:hypothetical protein Pmani_025222 [Petrolisthes manimaculis]
MILASIIQVHPYSKPLLTFTYIPGRRESHLIKPSSLVNSKHSFPVTPSRPSIYPIPLEGVTKQAKDPASVDIRAQLPHDILTRGIR